MCAIYIIDKGVESGPFDQAQAEGELSNYPERELYANMRQALNDVTFGRGRPTGGYTYNGHRVLHASSGNGQRSISLFFYHTGNDDYLIAMGEHSTTTTYLLRYFGQRDGDFRKGRTIIL